MLDSVLCRMIAFLCFIIAIAAPLELKARSSCSNPVLRREGAYTNEMVQEYGVERELGNLGATAAIAAAFETQEVLKLLTATRRAFKKPFFVF